MPARWTTRTLDDGRWRGRIATPLATLADAVARHVFDAHAIHADDAPVQMPALDVARIRAARLWAQVRDEHQLSSAVPQAAFYGFFPDRKGSYSARHVAGFEGGMHVHGYAGFEDRDRDGTMACLAHARCKVADVAGHED